MFHKPELFRINGSNILWLIRDERARSIEDLKFLLLPGDVSPHRIVHREREIEEIVRNLIAAGLIAEKNGFLACTALLEKVQTALDISLRQFSDIGPNSIMVKPTLGQPEALDDKPDVFVLMPFAETLLPVYEDHITKVTSDLNLTIVRADDFFTARSIITDIWNAIYNSRIIIAECTGRNPNVFYENRNCSHSWETDDTNLTRYRRCSLRFEAYSKHSISVYP